MAVSPESFVPFDELEDRFRSRMPKTKKAQAAEDVKKKKQERTVLDANKSRNIAIALSTVKVCLQTLASGMASLHVCVCVYLWVCMSVSVCV